MNLKKYICMAGIIFPMTIAAQQDKTLCDFENADSYASVGVYDTWEQSPFCTLLDGVLQNCSVFFDCHGRSSRLPSPMSITLPSFGEYIITCTYCVFFVKANGSFSSTRAPNVLLP